MNYAQRVGWLFEKSVEQSLEASTMTCLILSHFMYCIVDSVEVQLLCHLCNLQLASTSTFFKFFFIKCMY